MIRFWRMARGILLVLCVLSPTFLGDRATAQSGVWTTKAPMPTARAGLAAGVVNGVLYAVGGWRVGSGVLATVEAYDPTSDTWTTRAPMPTPRSGLAAGVVNGILYAVGGIGYAGGPVLAVVEAYNPVTNTWTTKAPMPTPRTSLAVGVVNGILYTVGGGANSTDAPLATVEAYDPANNTWATRAPMPKPREWLGVGVVNGLLYVVGGNTGGGLASDVQAYDPVTNTWTMKVRKMPVSLQGHVIGVVNGRIYAVGDDPFPIVEAYDPATNTWTTMTPMPTVRFSLAAGVVGGVLYAVGGVQYPGVSLATNEAFDPSGASVVNVQIDIQPGVFPNTVDLSSPGSLSVAILTTPTFNAADVAAKTVRLARAAITQSTLTDVDGDSDLDLLLGFSIAHLDLTCASTITTLTGSTKTSAAIVGADSVLITRDKNGQACQ